MRLGDLLVYLDPSPHSDARLRLASALARQHDAHLIGLYVRSPQPDHLSPIDDPAMIASFLEQAREREAANADQVRTRFEDQMRSDAVLGEWRAVEGWPLETTKLHARYADLAILGQDGGASFQPAGLTTQVLFGSGRPVLVVPQAGNIDQIGNTVLIGWNGSREAARAVNDALPLLKRSSKVTVIAVNPSRGLSAAADLPASNLALHLSRHGIEATAAHVFSDERSEADTFLSYAADQRADLLVIGGYGHARLQEMIMGGVTRTLLRSAGIPVLMSH